MVAGSIKTVSNPSVTTNQVENPKFETIKANNAKIKNNSEKIAKLNVEKRNTEENIRKQLQANVGFLEELEAMFDIITSRPMAGVFYAIFFLLLMSLELFVVVSKMWDKECDYEMAIKRGLEIRGKQLNAVFNRTNAAFI